MKNPYVFFLVLLVCSGCAAIQEDAKIIWGSSTMALENERVNSARRTFSCGVQECYDAILAFANNEVQLVDPYLSTTTPVTLPIDPELSPKLKKNKTLHVFSKNRKRHVIVVMGIPEHVDTTEVGIFLLPAQGGGTLVEISSESTGAKTKVSEMIFQELAKNYKDLNL